MRLKKLCALTMASVMAVGLLAGCSSASSSSQVSSTAEASSASSAAVEERELNVAVFEGGWGSDYWMAVADLFEEKNPGVTVNVTANPKIGDIIRPNILAGNPPDFVFLHSTDPSGVTQAMIKDHALTDISDVMDEVKDKLLPGFVENTLCQPYGDGKTYLAPMYYSGTGLWYNKNYFETNGLEAPVTWDDFFALGEKVKEIDGRALYTYQGIYPTYNEMMVYPALMAGVGTDGYAAMRSYEEGAWDNDTVRAILNNIARIGTDGYLMDGTVALDHTQAQSEWLMGKAAFIPCGSYLESEMKDAPREDGFEWGFCTAPVMNEGDDRYVYTQIEEMWIPAAAKNVDLAKEFLVFQYSDEAIQLSADLAGGIPPVIGAAKAVEGKASDAVYSTYTMFDEGCLPVIGSPFGVVSDTEISPYNEFFNQIGDVVSGNETVDEWIAKTEEISAQVRDKLVTN